MAINFFMAVVVLVIIQNVFNDKQEEAKVQQVKPHIIMILADDLGEILEIKI